MSGSFKKLLPAPLVVICRCCCVVIINEVVIGRLWLTLDVGGKLRENKGGSGHGLGVYNKCPIRRVRIV